MPADTMLMCRLLHRRAGDVRFAPVLIPGYCPRGAVRPVVRNGQTSLTAEFLASLAPDAVTLITRNTITLR
jgi:hypothetical protein